MCGRTNSFDMSRLSQLIDSRYDRKSFAELSGIRVRRLDSLLSGRSEFTQAEIIRMSAVLGINAHEIRTYFFARKVQKL